MSKKDQKEMKKAALKRKRPRTDDSASPPAKTKKQVRRNDGSNAKAGQK